MITKTNFLTYKECPKHLWIEKNESEKISKDLSLFDQFSIKQGYEIEALACKLFPNGVSVNYGNKDTAVEETRKQTEAKATIYQGTFIYKDFLVKTDILKYNKKTKLYDIYEVKSVTELKKEHYIDICFQKIVCSKAGLAVEKTYIIHINGDYKRLGEVNIHELFCIEDVSEDIKEIEQETLLDMENAAKVVKLGSSNILESCYKPKTCICPESCHPHLPEYSIYDIARISKKKKDILRDDYILEIDEIPEELKFSENQESQIRLTKQQTSLIKTDEIQTMIRNIEYPLYFLDYETFNPAIPLYDGYKPYQQMVFQYSLHVIDGESEMKHYEFLAKEDKDPVPDMMKLMTQQIETKGGTIIVWNKSFETGRNSEIGNMYPEHKEYMETVNERVYDLMEVFSQGLYQDYRFKGSASIKKVLPILVPELSYKDLEIQEGQAAQMNWYEMVFKMKDRDQKEKTYKELLKYCKLDTLAMVKIWEVLENL